jgi:hypothetical protein
MFLQPITQNIERPDGHHPTSEAQQAFQLNLGNKNTKQLFYLGTDVVNAAITICIDDSDYFFPLVKGMVLLSDTTFDKIRVRVVYGSVNVTFNAMFIAVIGGEIKFLQLP